MLKMIKSSAKALMNEAVGILPEPAKNVFKEFHELRYWRRVILPIIDDREKLELARAHYEFFFTSFFSLTKDDYKDRKVIDIGCGPRGSLEWLNGAKEQVGLDPLAGKYQKLIKQTQTMTYCAAYSEAVPYPCGHFDVVSVFNSLDHVADVDRTIAELKRITAPRGWLLLIVEIGHEATATEPHWLDEELLIRFEPEFVPFSVRTFGVAGNHDLYASLGDEVPYVEGQPGILCARLERTS